MKETVRVDGGFMSKVGTTPCRVFRVPLPLKQCFRGLRPPEDAAESTSGGSVLGFGRDYRRSMMDLDGGGGLGGLLSRAMREPTLTKFGPRLLSL